MRVTFPDFSVFCGGDADLSFPVESDAKVSLVASATQRNATRILVDARALVG